MLDITVFQAPELSKTIQVSEAGTINFPLIGEVEAAGKTAREVEQELRKRLGSEVSPEPSDFSFSERKFQSARYARRRRQEPGVDPIAGGMTLLQAIAQAQGFRGYRHEDGGSLPAGQWRRLAARYDVSSIRDGSVEDPQLQAGDVIIAPTST